MSTEIYPSDFHTRWELTHATSISMSRFYNDIGKMTIVAPVNDYNINALKVGNLVYDTEKNVTYYIVNTKHDTDNNRITANGYTTNWLLNQRVMYFNSDSVFNAGSIEEDHRFHMTTIETGAYDIINEVMRGLPRVNTASVKGLTEATDVYFYGGYVMDELIPILEEKGLGHRMVWNPDTLTHTFEIYKGNDLTQGIHAVVFSEEHGTAQELVIDDDDSTLKNFAYVTLTLNNGQEDVPWITFVGVEGYSDERRRELWFDSGVSTENIPDTDVPEPWDATIARAQEAAYIELGQRIRRHSFSVAVDSDEFGTIYKLGDIVSCVSVRFGVSFNARITGVKYKMDTNSKSTEIILGDPILTALGELKLNG